MEWTVKGKNFDFSFHLKIPHTKKILRSMYICDMLRCLYFFLCGTRQAIFECTCSAFLDFQNWCSIARHFIMRWACLKCLACFYLLLQSLEIEHLYRYSWLSIQLNSLNLKKLLFVYHFSQGSCENESNRLSIKDLSQESLFIVIDIFKHGYNWNRQNFDRGIPLT